ncbi:MAG: MBL fold metallo-hydrolase [Chitinivibrionales bacterium]|nr:MBL fold metallo-hydrolase [Chitinivibrionales bacterium]
MPLTIKRLPLGPIETNSYVVANDENACLIIDPSQGCEELFSHVNEHKLKPAAIVLTHGHFDHIMGIPEVRERFGEIDVWAHPAEELLLTNSMYNASAMMGIEFTYTGPVRHLTEGRVAIGEFEADVLHIPGHSPGSVVVCIENNCFCGDVIFAGSIGRTDFPGGSMDTLLSGIRRKLFTLPDDTVLHSGHGGRTTIGREKKHNPFLQ